MRRLLLFIPLMLLTLVSMASCGEPNNEPFVPEQPENPGENDNNPDTPTSGGNGRYLVLYASRTNNTKQVAELIQSTLDCDILEVEPQTPYDNDYNAMLERSQEELAAIRQGNFPPIKTSMENFDNYDIVFVGYPIWYGSIATPMQTFLHEHAEKLAGKRIALFSTSGSSGISSSVSEARNLCPDATIIEQSLLLTSSSISQMATRVPAWLDEIGANREEPDTPEVTSLKINLTVGDHTISATMEDNDAARDFLSRLPLEVTLNDYNNTTEKIFYPDPELRTEGVTRGCAPTPGDITIYVPWGNVAIFCKNWSHSNDLIKIGHIDGDGIDALNVGGDIKVKIEKQ
ncbi:cyclophilin-like fold protein [Paraprevotella xylaniphila]|nr:cyclophilin-like fold protein [Paraprevotella xylaniphila]